MPYTLRTDYRDHQIYRDAYFRFTPKVFDGLSFAEWCHKGGWNDQYQVFSFFDGDEIVANVSVLVLTLLLEGQRARGIQFSAVGTLPAYRCQGLARQLIAHVLAYYEASTDLFFLFANDSVLDFYPKFGFRLVQDYEFLAEMPELYTEPVARALDPHNAEDWALLAHYAHHRRPISQVFSATNYGHVLLYHALNRAHLVWYLAPLETVIAYEIQGDILEIYDIASPYECDLRAVLRGLSLPGVKCVRFHFTPDLMTLPTQAMARDQRVFPCFVRGTFSIQSPFRFPAMGET